MRQVRALWAITALVLVSTALSAAQDPCQPLQVAGSSSLQYKNRGNRCEGLYVQHIGAQALAVVSLTLGEISYVLSASTKLSVSVPGQNTAVSVRAIPKSSSLGYEMDAQAAAGAPLVWPVNDVLLPEHLSASQLGVYGWKNDGAAQVFMPVAVSTYGTAPSLSKDVLLTVRPSFDVQTLKWRWSSVVGAACAAPGPWQNGTDQTIDGGQTVTIRLPPSPGRHCIEFAAQGSTTDWLTTHFEVEVPAL
jgi:hypothetical protein